jgi:dihydrofolate reductase
VSITTYYTATSLDGFIADAQHSLEWLFRQDVDQDGPLNHDRFFGNIGAVAMGSSTYEWVLRHEDGRWPYQLPVWVLTTRDLPKADGDVRFARGDIRPVHDEMLGVAGGKDLWVVGGGDLAGQFADAGLLDEIIVYIAPVTLGRGAPLLPRELDLQLEELARNRAFACARYSVVRPAQGTGAGGDRG